MNGLWRRLDTDHRRPPRPRRQAHGRLGDGGVGIDGTDELDADRAVRAGSRSRRQSSRRRPPHRGASRRARRHQHRSGADRRGRPERRADGHGRHRQRRQPAREGGPDRRCADLPRHLPAHPRRVRGGGAGADRGPRQERTDADLRRAERETARLPHRCPRRRRGRDAGRSAANASSPGCRRRTNTSPTVGDCAPRWSSARPASGSHGCSTTCACGSNCAARRSASSRAGHASGVRGPRSG